jgi:hypothetical protein
LKTGRPPRSTLASFPIARAVGRLGFHPVLGHCILDTEEFAVADPLSYIERLRIAKGGKVRAVEGA